MDTLISLSGGMSSTYLTYKWLVENPDEILLIHHAKTNKKEHHATQEILKWFTDNNLTNWKYVEQEIAVEDNLIDVDQTTIFAFMEAILMKKYGIKYVLDSAIKDDMLVMVDEYVKHFKRKIAIFNTILGYNTNIYPKIRSRMRREIIPDIPDALLALTWSCQNTTKRKPCGECAKCKQIATAYQQIEENVI